MMYAQYTYRLLLFACLLSKGVLAQHKLAQARPSQLKLPVVQLATWHQYRSDTLRLLWMPVRPARWQLYSQYGYRIERAERINNQLTPFTPVTASPLLPSSINPSTDVGALAAQQALTNTKPIGTDRTGSQDANQQSFQHLMVSLAAFRSHQTARSLGLGLIDPSARRNKQYVYRIYPLLPVAQKRYADTAIVTISTYRPSEQPVPPQLTAEGQERTVLLSWPARLISRQFVLYHIERSDDGKTFHRLTKAPLLYTDASVPVMNFQDSVSTNYRPYSYRLVGMNPFGEWITSPYVILGMGRDLTPPAAPFVETARHIGGKRVLLRWKQEPAEGDLRGFYVSRANALRGSYKRLLIRNGLTLLPKTERTFTDFDADLNGTNHYIVVAVDTAGNERPSIPAYVTMSDSIPPDPPTGLIARVDTARGVGYVTLRWRRNAERDIQGYKVFYAHNPDQAFSQRTNYTLTDSVFRDTITLRTLTRQIFYRVVAVDQHYNHSAFSKPLTVNRPDVVRPVAPLVTEIVNRETDVLVRWQTSPSEDVAAYRLYRREINSNWVLVQTFNRSELSTREYLDKNVQEGHSYAYSVQVVDNSGLESERSPSRTGRPIGSVYLVDMPVIQARYDEARKATYLTWTKSPAPYRIVIYRSQNNGPLLQVGAAESSRSGIYDTSLPQGRYAYVAKTVLASGRQSRLSEEIIVRIP
ncbi:MULTISPECIES: hypothetical protein [unclassified Spirosoma]|uniref:fibronectin type III domain-containing protein n=1 Tax=unclassified Spirosoma TaxID=2621999 RepID=UPI00096849CA|nr:MULTISPECIES: hypothetical protein [unclassified Spirosoma]MBN8822162.1 fibronectin type III domain-containing protein [Spirosoma sp.]OJW80556.1 MAG: hypothetical protein BGO59_34335 [Spirosoma sp. 48-14]